MLRPLRTFAAISAVVTSRGSTRRNGSRTSVARTVKATKRRRSAEAVFFVMALFIRMDGSGNRGNSPAYSSGGQNRRVEVAVPRHDPLFVEPLQRQRAGALALERFDEERSEEHTPE